MLAGNSWSKWPADKFWAIIYHFNIWLSFWWDINFFFYFFMGENSHFPCSLFLVNGSRVLAMMLHVPRAAESVTNWASICGLRCNQKENRNTHHHVGPTGIDVEHHLLPRKLWHANHHQKAGIFGLLRQAMFSCYTLVLQSQFALM